MIAVLVSTFVLTSNHICLIGERNSGTNFFEEQLAGCFGRGNVEPRYTRWKHWFQERDAKKDCFVVAIVRNPVSWTLSMWKRPWHAPNHHNVSWPEFVKRRWTMPHSTFEPHNECTQSFPVGMAVPCGSPCVHTGPWEHGCPVYEMMSYDVPFSSILEMRSAKLENHISVSDYSVRYEDLLARGAGFAIAEISAATGLPQACHPAGPSPTRTTFAGVAGLKRWVCEKTNWASERMAGYTRASTC